jgi:hypothetical protein
MGRELQPGEPDFRGDVHEIAVSSWNPDPVPSAHKNRRYQYSSP